MSEDQVLEINEQTNSVGTAVKSEIVTLFTKMPDVLSEAIYDEFINVLAEENKTLVLDTDLLLKRFKEKISSHILHNFEETWSANDIEFKLNILNFLKNKAPDKTKKEWRPAGISATEQIRPYLIKVVNAKISYFKKQIEFQKKSFETIIPKIEQKREIIKFIMEKRKMLSYQMNVRKAMLPDIHVKIDNLCDQIDDLVTLNRS